MMDLSMEMYCLGVNASENNCKIIVIMHKAVGSHQIMSVHGYAGILGFCTKYLQSSIA